MADKLPLVDLASGRCHSCVNKVRYDIPSGSRIWCRSYGVDMQSDEVNQVKNCPRWRGLSIGRKRMPKRLANNLLLAPLLEDEDRLFAQLKIYLDQVDVDLKSLVLIARPHLVENLDWIDTLDDRFSGDIDIASDQLLDQLRQRGHSEIAFLAEPLISS